MHNKNTVKIQKNTVKILHFCYYPLLVQQWLDNESWCTANVNSTPLTIGNKNVVQEIQAIPVSLLMYY